jgi:hypothetical protein
VADLVRVPVPAESRERGSRSRRAVGEERRGERGLESRRKRRRMRRRWDGHVDFRAM